MDKNHIKSPYKMPVIEQVDIDNEMSLNLVSGNPGNPGVFVQDNPNIADKSLQYI